MLKYIIKLETFGVFLISACSRGLSLKKDNFSLNPSFMMAAVHFMHGLSKSPRWDLSLMSAHLWLAELSHWFAYIELPRV